MNYHLLYFARMGEEAGVAQEQFETDTRDALTLYAELSERHGFTLPVDSLRIAVNGVFVDWDHGLGEGDEITFIPPVSGG
ncbi:MAG: MoaD/ThiS family protein [Rhodanobacteraceae bacterium]